MHLSESPIPEGNDGIRQAFFTGRELCILITGPAAEPKKAIIRSQWLAVLRIWFDSIPVPQRIQLPLNFHAHRRRDDAYLGAAL